MNMNPEQVQQILEAALMVAGRPLTAADLQKLFEAPNEINTKEIREILLAMQERYTHNGIELREVASGFQFQAKAEFSPWLSKLWEERPQRYSRAVLETIALIAYRQPITRAEIEEIRGVAVSSNIIKTLQEREWIKVIGCRDVPGKPELFATTKTFLDHLNLKALDELPPLSEILDMESQEEKLQVQLELAAAPSNINTEEADSDHHALENETNTTEVELDEDADLIAETTTTETELAEETDLETATAAELAYDEIEKEFDAKNNEVIDVMDFNPEDDNDDSEDLEIDNHEIEEENFSTTSSDPDEE